VKSIGSYCFLGCSSLIIITVPDSVQSIGKYYFSKYSSLISIIIPNSIHLIGLNSFEGCLSLQNFSISIQNPPKIQIWKFQKSFFPHATNDVFKGCPFNLI
jgi:hypothetical protein